MSTLRLWGLIIAVGALPLIWNGCSKFGTGSSSLAAVAAAPADGGQQQTQTPTSAGAAAFQSGLYAFVNTQGCVQCHGGIVHPTFAAPDFATAYAAAKGTQIGSNAPLVDFNNPDSSIFIDYAGNGHCNALPCSNPNVRPQVKSALEAWAAAELGTAAASGAQSTVPAGMYVTLTMPIPADLPVLTAGSAKVMRFDLSQISPGLPALLGAVFEISIEMANATEYRVSSPRLGGNGQSVTVQRIHVYVRPSSGTGIGTEDTAQGSLWTTVNTSVAPSTLPASGPLTTMPLSNSTLYIQSQSSSDVITIGFEGI